MYLDFLGTLYFFQQRCIFFVKNNNFDCLRNIFKENNLKKNLSGWKYIF